MKVAELQRFFGNIAPFVKAAGASEKVATEFDRAFRCLEPFKEKTLVEFNDFLLRADEFDRTGKLTPPARASNGKPRAQKSPGLSVEEAVKICQDLYVRATEPSLSYAEIDAKMTPLDKLTIAQLQEVAAKVGAVVPTKPKKEILGALMRRIKELKASHERTQFRFGETA
jgi:hypothetical protein